MKKLLSLLMAVVMCFSIFGQVVAEALPHSHGEHDEHGHAHSFVDEPDSFTDTGESETIEQPRKNTYAGIESEEAQSVSYRSEDNVWTYTVNSDGTITLSAYSGSASDLIIPEVVDGQSVSGVGNSLFANHSEIRSVSLPSSVTAINAYAFSGCTSLTDIVLPEGLTYLAARAFNGCTSLVSVYVPASLAEANGSQG
ncbi:MAG: leucine-rich repeat protein [Clostridia bacterium]|nr:leucine-rich repeat protein [Clostridia bacterium]